MPAMAGAAPTPRPEIPRAATGVLANDLRETLERLTRVLRAGRGLGGSFSDQAVRELSGWLEAVTGQHGEVTVNVEVDRLAFGTQPMVILTERDDPALFRLHGEGVREIEFRPDLPSAELRALLEVLASEEGHEEDIVSRLGDAGVRGVTVSLAAADSRTPQATEPDLEGLREAASLVASALNSLDPVVSTSTELGHPDLEELAENLDGALERLTPFLAGSTLTVLDRAGSEDQARLSAMVGNQLIADARRSGLAECQAHLEKIEAWLDERKGTDLAEVVSRSLFSAGMRSTALYTLKRDPDGLPGALAILRCLPQREAAKALPTVCGIPPSFARTKGIAALMGGDRAQGAAKLFASVDHQAARAILKAVRDAPLDEGTEALFRAALEYPDELVRALAVGWFVRQGGAQAVPALERGLRDPDATVRTASLFLIGTSSPEVGLPVMRGWLDSAEFRAVDMDEKRRAALVYATVGGPDALPVLRSLLGKLNVTGDAKTDELRAAGAAGLGQLRDEGSRKRITKMSKGRRRSEALLEETGRVLAAWKVGGVPHEDPMPELEELAIDLGLIDPPPDPEGGKGDLSSEPSIPVDMDDEFDVDIPIDIAGDPLAATSQGPTDDVIKELLEGYSFDDIPTDGGERGDG